MKTYARGYEAIRYSKETGLQRCGHSHSTRQLAEKCGQELNKSNPKVRWGATQLAGRVTVS